MGIELILASIALAISVASVIFAPSLPSPRGDIGTKIKQSGALVSRQVPYGTAIVNGASVLNNVKNSNRKWLLSVFSLGVGEIHAIRQVYLDDQPILLNENTGSYDPNSDKEYYYARDECTPRAAYSYERRINKDDTETINVPERTCTPQVFQGKFRNQNMKMQFRYGEQTETSLTIAKTYSDNGQWTDAHRGDKVPQIALVIERSLEDNAVVLNAGFKITALVDGVPLHDPRFHADGVKEFYHSAAVPEANRVCGRNPVLATLDFLTNTYYGMGMPLEMLNIDSFKSAANWADLNELTVGGALDTTQSFGDCISSLLSAFQGLLVIERGIIVCKYEDVTVPLATVFDESNTLDLSNIIGESKDSFYNVVEVEYKNGAIAEKGDVYQIPADIGENGDTILLRDGFIKTHRIELPMTVDNVASHPNPNDDPIDLNISDNELTNQDAVFIGDYNTQETPAVKHDFYVRGAVKMFANRALIKAMFPKGVTIEIDLSIYEVNVYDVIKISNEIMGWTEKLFRVVTIEKSVTGDQFNIGRLLCVEYDDSVYLGDHNAPSGQGTPNIPKILEAVTNIAFSLNEFSNSRGAGVLTWDDTLNEAGGTYVIEYKLSTEPDSSFTHMATTNDTTVFTNNLKFDSVDYRISVVKVGWVVSDYSELLATPIGPIIVVPDVIGATATLDGSDVVFEWNDMTEVDIPNAPDLSTPESYGGGLVKDVFHHYEIVISHGAVVKNTYISTVPRYVYTFDRNFKDGVGTTSRDIRAAITIVANESSKSVNPALVSVVNTQIGSPNIESLIDSYGTSTLTWLPRDELDFAGTLVYVGTTIGFTPDADTLVSTLQGDSSYTHIFDTTDTTDRYIKVAHFDRFSRTGVSYSTSGLMTFIAFAGAKGDTGIAGPIGPDGTSNFFHLAYADDEIGTGFSQVADGKAYIGTYVDEILADAPSGDPLWKWQAVVGADGVSNYFHLAYADSTSGDGFSSDPTGKSYIGTYVDDSPIDQSASHWKWNWQLVTGTTGAIGATGADGTSSYFHVAYSDDNVGGGFSQSPINKAYIGTYTDFTLADAGSGSGLWKWQLVLGAVGATGETGLNGEDGIAGVDGTNGKTSYLHIAYADDASGNGFSQLASGKPFIGQYVDFVLADSTSQGAYAWTLIKGSRGSGVFQLTAYNDTWVANWNSDPQASIDALLVAMIALIESETGDTPSTGDAIAIHSATIDVASIAMKFVGGDYNASANWIQYAEYIDGSLLVTGSVDGNSISSNTDVRAGTAGNQAGTVDIAVMSGTSDGLNIGKYGFWCGNNSPVAAPFSVKRNGELKATKAEIEGKLTAGAGSVIDGAHITELTVDTLHIKDTAITEIQTFYYPKSARTSPWNSQSATDRYPYPYANDAAEITGEGGLYSGAARSTVLLDYIIRTPWFDTGLPNYVAGESSYIHNLFQIILLSYRDSTGSGSDNRTITTIIEALDVVSGNYFELDRKTYVSGTSGDAYQDFYTSFNMSGLTAYNKVRLVACFEAAGEYHKWGLQGTIQSVKK